MRNRTGCVYLHVGAVRRNASARFAEKKWTLDRYARIIVG